MTEAAARPSRFRRWKYLLIACGVLVVLVLSGLWYVTTDSFQSLVRRGVIAELERVTGGRAEIGTFHTIPFQMRVEVRDITVRGREAAADVPLAHADSLIARVKVNSFLRTEFGFREVSLDHPVVHVAFYPDGSTNVPGPTPPVQSGRNPVDALFALSIDHLYMRRGELLWDDRQIPLDFDVHDANLQMDYRFLRGRYEGRLLLGKVDTKFRDMRPFSWMTAIEFALEPNAAEIKSLKVNSGRSHVEANGTVSNLRRPLVDANYEISLDLAEAASIARNTNVREGRFELHGKGNWSLDEFAGSGSLALRDASGRSGLVVVNKASATSDYVVTDRQLKLSKFQGKVFGGSVSGEALVDNWLYSTPLTPEPRTAAKGNLPVISASPLKGQRPKPGVQAGTVRVSMHDLSAAELVAALKAASHPLGSFRAVGFASGTMDARWRGPAENAEVAFAVDVKPPALAGPGEVPLTGHAQGTYRGALDSLELSQFTLATPASHIQVSGILSKSSSLRLSVSTSNLEEWRPLVAALHGPAELPFRINGGAAFHGVLGGTVSSPILSGGLAAQDFSFLLAATSRTPQTDVHWDLMSANVQVSSRILSLRNGSLQRGDTTAEFEATANLVNGRLVDESAITARVNLHNVDVASTAALAGFDYPVTGNADLFLELSGTRAHLEGRGQVHGTNGSVFGEAIAQLDTDFQMGNGEAAFSNIHLVHDAALVTGSAAYNPGARTFRLDLSGRNFDLATVRQIHLDKLAVEGHGDFTLQGSGTVDRPALSAAVQIRDLTLDHELAGGLELDAVSDGSVLRLKGRSQFTKGNLTLEGTLQMQNPYNATLTADMDQVDLDALWRSYLGGQLTGHSAVAGSVALRGPLRDPNQWTMNGTLTGLALDVEYAKLHNQDPIRFSYAQRVLRLDQLHMAGEGTDLAANGTISFAGSRDLDLKASGHADMKLLNSFDPGITASGQVTLNMTVGGTLNEPMPQGRLELSGGAITYAGMPSGLSEMNGALSFTRNQLHIDALTARTGGGTLDLKGDATTYNGQLSFNFTAVGKDVRLRYPPGVSSTANAELHWAGKRSASTISGDIFVTKLAVTPNFDFSSYLERSRQIGAITPANSPLYNVKLDIHVQTAPELQMKTAVARLSGDADLRLRGSVAQPVVLGRADILEGDATFNGTKFRLERGDITFADPVSITPQLNLQASTHVRNYDLNVTVTGTPDRLAVNYRSEPPLPKSDIIALLALGRTSQESEQLQQQSGLTPFTDEASALILNQAINATVSSRIQKLFGVSRIKIDPQGLTTETNPTARGPQVTIEQQFANNISLTYSTNVSQSTQQIIQGEYYFTRNISVVGTRDQNGVVSFDLRIRRQKK